MYIYIDQTLVENERDAKGECDSHLRIRAYEAMLPLSSKKLQVKSHFVLTSPVHVLLELLLTSRFRRLSELELWDIEELVISGGKLT